jgi:hypothetical protein
MPRSYELIIWNPTYDIVVLPAPYNLENIFDNQNVGRIRGKENYKKRAQFEISVPTLDVWCI